MTTLLADPRDVRYVQRATLEGAGVELSPEFEQALWPLAPGDAEPKEKLVTGGVQAGKSTQAAAETYVEFPAMDMDRSLSNGERDPYRFWYIMPSYETPKTELEYLLAWCRGYYGHDSVTDSMPAGGAAELSLFGGRAIVETRSSRNPEAIAARACDKVIVCEAGQQPGSVRDAALERTVTRRGPVVYTGTLEDDEAKPRFAWYDTLAQKWEDDWSEGIAVSLPTWANVAKFPLGINDPFIQDRKARLPDYVFERRYGGKARGVQYPLYSELMIGDWGFDCSQPAVWVWSLGAGGHDFGSEYGHPSTLVAVTVTQHNIAVVRDAWSDNTSNTDMIETMRSLMSQRFNITRRRWGFDPMQREAAVAMDAQAMTDGTRLVRAGRVQARVAANRLKFDMSNPRVVEVFEQMKRIHMVKRTLPAKGEVYEYARVDDDLAAAVENAIVIIDGLGPDYSALFANREVFA